MIRYRTFLNGDSPALAGLWNRGTPDRGVVRPLNGHEFDAMVIGRINFEAEGLIVAEEDGQVLGFAHAGFGPESPDGPSHQLDGELGTLAMLVVDPARDDPQIADGLLNEAEAYLRRRGAKVFYAGGQGPLDPFYWGVYGGSEFSGILADDRTFRQTVVRAGYQEVASMVLLEADLALCEPRDPKSVIIRRQTKVEMIEDAPPLNWWEAIALGQQQITRFRLISKADDSELARASTWEMAAFGRLDGRAHAGLVLVEVVSNHRRKGYGRHLIAEILKHLKAQWGEVVAVQTASTNLAALALYRSVGFEAVDSSTFYRKPGLGFAT